MPRVKYRRTKKTEVGADVVTQAREADEVASLHSFLAIVTSWRTVSVTNQMKGQSNKRAIVKILFSHVLSTFSDYMQNIISLCYKISTRPGS